jgi:hypothetical protein
MTQATEEEIALVRLLLNDVEPFTYVFEDEDIDRFLTLEGGSVKRAAAQAIDTNADNEALASKVLTSKDLSTDGAKLAEALHKRAAALRTQADREDELAEDAGGFVDVVDYAPAFGRVPELTEWPINQ